MKLRPRLRKTSHLQAAINYCKEKTDHTSLTSCWIDDKQPENEEEATDSDVSDNSVVPAATNDSSSLENMSFCGLLKLINRFSKGKDVHRDCHSAHSVQRPWLDLSFLNKKKSRTISIKNFDKR
ncbi:uncharacterized protein [Apostichopus japonicus]|uniref:uncharacterized protein isoform X3 n=1 Tax=Stichopus japonicus TaxID=307972 RepID=UPI003AB28E23